MAEPVVKSGDSKTVAVKKFGRYIFLAILFFYAVYLLCDIAAKPGFYQHDFRNVYYDSTKAWIEGINPYDDLAVARRFPGKEVWNGYRYPPFTFYIFKIFGKMDYDKAYYLFLFLKTAALTGLILLWSDMFFDSKVGIAFYALCLLGFNGTIYQDMVNGNVSMFEQIMLWSSFVFFLKERLLLFCAFVLLSAIFKLNTIFFLALLIVSENRKKYLLLSGSILAFGLFFLLQKIAQPVLFDGFVRDMSIMFAPATMYHGIICPTTLAFVKDLLGYVTDICNIRCDGFLFRWVFLAVAAVIAALSWRTLKRLSVLDLVDKKKWAIFFLCTVYVMLNPRVPDYAYIIMLAPAYFLVWKATSNIGQINILSRKSAADAGPLFIFIVLLTSRVRFPGIGYDVGKLFWDYYLLIMTFLVWCLYLREIDCMHALTRKFK